VKSDQGRHVHLSFYVALQSAYCVETLFMDSYLGIVSEKNE
jgi:hypothetical protein